MGGTSIRVLHVIDSLAPGGAETSLVAMAPYMADQGIQLDVVCLHRREGLADDLRSSGARVGYLDGQGLPRKARQLRTHLRRTAPALVHTSLTDAGFVGRVAALGRCPLVCSLVNVQYGPEQLADPNLAPWKVRSVQLADAISARKVRRFHAVAADVADVMARRLRVRRERMDVIPRGRDPLLVGQPSAERRAAVRSRLGLGDDRVILAVGRLEYQKGFDVLLDAYALVKGSFPSSRLLIAGKAGKQKAELQDRARVRGLDPERIFLGHRSDVPDLLSAADVFVLPSRFEGSPGALIEAMAMGANVVASDIGPVREVLGPSPDAWLVPPDDAALLSRGIAAAFPGGGVVRETLRERFLDRFTIAAVSTQMARFYERALAA